MSSVQQAENVSLNLLFSLLLFRKGLGQPKTVKLEEWLFLLLLIQTIRLRPV